MFGMQYTASFSSVAVSAAQDLFEILVPSDACLVLTMLEVTQSSEEQDAQDEQLPVSIRRVTGSPTSGSGGSTPTPAPLQGGYAASGVTCEANNTTQLSGGTNTVAHKLSFNVRNGLLYMPLPENRIVISPSTRLLVELESAPADEVTMDGSITWLEIGG